MSNNIITIQQPHPLKRGGSTRLERLLKALSPDQFQLDDRSMQDLMVAAHRYAHLQSWFDADDRPDGNWACFWETETLTYLAVLSALDLDQLRQTYDDADYALGVLLESSGPDEPQQEQEAYRRLIRILLGMALGLEERYRKLVAIRHPLQRQLLGLIKKANQIDTEELSSSLEVLIALNKAFDDHLMPSSYKAFIQPLPDNRWGLPDLATYGRISAMASAAYPREQLRGIFVKFFQAYSALRHAAQRAFDQELARMDKPETEEYRLVQPHISLFIAFLRLFRHAQESLNGLVKKQLDFYYEKVLALQPAPARPDSVHLIFTLAKNFEPQLVEKGAQLFAGKDANGRPLIYETVRDWVVTQAKLEDMRSFYLPESIYSFNYNEFTQYTENLKTLMGKNYALPLGNEGSRAFSDKAELPEEEVGFVIASPQLLLQEGKRLIKVEIKGVNAAILTKEILEVRLSEKKGWNKEPIAIGEEVGSTNYFSEPPARLIDLPTVLEQAYFDWVVSSGSAILHIFLPKDFPPVVPIEGSAMTPWPALKITLKKDSLKAIGADYKNLVIASSSDSGKAFEISVRAEGVSKNLILQTDQGVFNGTQQVMPFGPTAPKGSRFYVGFAEAFMKKLDRVVLKPNWVEPFADATAFTGHYAGYRITNADGSEVLPAVSPSFATVVKILNGNEFIDVASTTGLAPFAGDSGFMSLTISGFSRDYLADNRFTQYDPSVKRGFLRLTFDGELHHNIYPERLALKSIGAVPTTDLPNSPFVPRFNAIELDYLSKAETLDSNVDQFFYLHPFGGYEQAPKEEAFGQVTLFKDFIGANNHRGHLYLGFSQLEGGSSLSLLVQTAEGSEKKATVDAPQLLWSYLKKNNTWENIPPDKVLLDSTRGFTRSGIVQLGIPEDLSSEGNTLLNPALRWLRVSAIEQSINPESRTAALPDLTYLHAQVIEARFVDNNGNEYGHLGEGLPENTISKLALSRSAVKKIEQPFKSFDGRKPEAEGMAFYQRVSERLRHRDRAVTVWDYEHLLLEEYPNIATAKCIPHTQYRLVPASELAPGSVTVAVIPDLNKRSGASLEQPRFPKGDLDDMRDFLLERATFFLGVYESQAEPSLHVINAQYEPLSLLVNVNFKKEVLDIAFYTIQLAKDLQAFLSPWLNGGAAPAFGQNLRRSRLIQFIEQLTYIDYVDVDTLGFSTGTFVDEYRSPTAAHSILCGASQHTINGESISLTNQ